MAFNTGPASPTGGLPSSITSIPAVMSSFLKTQTYFSTSASVDPPAPPLPSTPSSATTNTVKTSAAGKSASTRTSSSNESSSGSQTVAAGATPSNSSTQTSAGSISSSALIVSSTGSTLSTSYTAPAAATASLGTSGVLSEAKSCSGISCSPGMQAAVAVPVTLIALGLIIAFIVFARRRRREGSSPAVSNDGEPRGSKWARHLRVFSFDAELLIGGRSSRATSVRSGPTTQSHPSQTSLRSQQPSVRSLESPAPPYRDALAAGGVQMAMRPDSQLTAPPPYIANRASYRPNSRLSTISPPPTAALDPFADPEDADEPASPASPISMVPQSSTAYHPVRADDASFVSSQDGGEPSDAGSIRQAEVARRVSGARRP